MTQYAATIGTTPQTMSGTLAWGTNGALQSLSILDPFNTSDNAQVCDYSYDDLGRVSKADCGSFWYQTFGYDAFGNITKNGTDAWTPTYYHTLNQYAPGWQGPNNAVQYDGNGRSLKDGFNTYTWDTWGDLTSANGNPVTYDAFGRMVESGTGSYMQQYIYSTTGGPPLATAHAQILNGIYLPLPGGGIAMIGSTGTGQYNHPDWLGSARVFSSPSQVPTKGFAYAPFGEGYAQNSNQWIQFTEFGNAWTSGGDSNQGPDLDDFMFRRYSPGQGRWISPDPAGLVAVDPTNPQTWNRYAYVANNPLSFVDPTGLQLIGPIGTPGSIIDGSALDPMGGGGIWGSALNGTLFNVTQYDFSASKNFQWGQFGLSDLLQFAAEGEISLDAVTPLGVFGFPGGGFGSAGTVSPTSGGTIRINTLRLVTTKDICRGGDRTITYNLVDMNTGKTPTSDWWVTEHIQSSVATNSGGTDSTPNQYTDWITVFLSSPYNALQNFTISPTQRSGGASFPVIVRIGEQDYGTLGLWVSKNPLRNGQPSPDSINCPPQ
jgi:RHS repeat-associated protein